MNLTDAQKQEFIKDLKNLMTYKDMSKKYKLPGMHSIWRITKELGFPSNYRRLQLRKKPRILPLPKQVEKRKQEFIQDIKNLMPQPEMAKKYKLSTPCVVYWQAVKLGFPKRYRIMRRKEVRDKIFVEANKALCELPNLSEFARRNNISKSYPSKCGVRARRIKCYKQARNKCRICGKPRAGNRLRLCNQHLKAYNIKKDAGEVAMRPRIPIGVEIGKSPL